MGVKRGSRILKAEMFAELPPEPDLPGHSVEQTEQSGGGEEETARMARLVIAETRLLACRLLNDARQQAEELLDRARQQAEQQAEEIIQVARREADKIREEARQAGYETGYREGLQALEDERQKLQEAESRMKKDLEQQRLQMIRELEPSVVELSLNIARAVIRSELKSSPEQVLHTVKAVLARVAGLDEVTLRVASSDFATVSRYCQARVHAPAAVKVRADERLQPGDCVAETGCGTVDGTVEGQLEEIRERFLEAAGNG